MVGSAVIKNTFPRYSARQVVSNTKSSKNVDNFVKLFGASPNLSKQFEAAHG
jgi:hypothetical protein